MFDLYGRREAPIYYPIKTIWSDPEIKVFTSEDLSRPHRNLNVDIEVRDDIGRWSATFFTIENLSTLFMKNEITGECARGTYIWAADMVVVHEVSERSIVDTVMDLRQSDEFERAFQLLDDTESQLK